MYMYYSCFRYLGSFCFPSFYYCKFPCSDAAGSKVFLLVGEIFRLGLVCSVVSMKTVMVWRVVKGFDFGGKTCGVSDKRWSLLQLRSFFHVAAEGSMQAGGGEVLLY